MSPNSTERPGARRRGLQRVLPAALAILLCACSGGAVRPPAGPAPVAGPDPQAVTGFTEALALLEAGEDTQAESRLRALVDNYPDYAGPMVNLALIRARRDELDPAAALLERAVRACGQCAPAWTELGLVQRRQGRFVQAEQSYLAAIAADDGYANAHFNLAVLYDLYLQRPELALAEYGRYRDLDATPGEVDKWITDLQRRTRAVERSARLEDTP